MYHFNFEICYCMELSLVIALLTNTLIKTQPSNHIINDSQR